MCLKRMLLWHPVQCQIRHPTGTRALCYGCEERCMPIETLISVLIGYPRCREVISLVLCLITRHPAPVLTCSLVLALPLPQAESGKSWWGVVTGCPSDAITDLHREAWRFFAASMPDDLRGGRCSLRFGLPSLFRASKAAGSSL